MPLIKCDNPSLTGAQAPRDARSPLADLNSPDVEVRWRAARGIAPDPKFVAPLAKALEGETVSRIREAIFTKLMRIGDQTSVRALLPYLRAQDASVRTAAIDALRAMPDAALPFMASLFSDADSDVRILAAELVRDMPAAKATSLLVALLDRETHPNVCGAAVEVLTELGTPDALPMLRICAERFAGTPFLSFAISHAITRISRPSD
jgi:HEAT repeat protein